MTGAIMNVLHHCQPVADSRTSGSITCMRSTCLMINEAILKRSEHVWNVLITDLSGDICL